MSAFLVRQPVIATLATKISRATRSSVYDVWGCGMQVRTRSLANLLIDAPRLEEALTIMNLEALRARYGYAAMLEDCAFVDFDDPGEGGWTPVQFLKHLQCLIYQCSEGNVPDCELYKYLCDVELKMAKAIVEHSAAYDAANWG